LQKVSTLEHSITSLDREKQEYTPILAKIKQIQEMKTELERKTAVINALKSDSSLTVRVLDEVAKVVDSERLWLLSLNQQGGSLQLEGIALDNQTVAQFMDSLILSPFITSVDLTDSSLRNIAGRDLKSFSLTCSVSQPTAGKSLAQSGK
jgi:type IV pilus assembly protein PilN